MPDGSALISISCRKVNARQTRQKVKFNNSAVKWSGVYQGWNLCTLHAWNCKTFSLIFHHDLVPLKEWIATRYYFEAVPIPSGQYSVFQKSKCYLSANKASTVIWPDHSNSNTSADEFFYSHYTQSRFTGREHFNIDSTTYNNSPTHRDSQGKKRPMV